MDPVNPAPPVPAPAGATPPAFDMAGLSKAIGDAVKTGIAEAMKPYADNQKIIADTMAADVAAKAGKPPGKGKDDEAAKPMTAADLQKVLDDRDNAAKARGQRDAFIAEKLKGVPAVYQAKLGTDPAKFAEEAQAIQSQWAGDLKSVGFVPKDVGGSPGGVSAGTLPTGAPPAPPAMQGLTPGQTAYAQSIKLPAK